VPVWKSSALVVPPKGMSRCVLDVDPARDHQAAGGVNNARGIFRGKLGGNGGDFVAVDADVGEACVR